MAWLRFNRHFRSIELFAGGDVGARVCSVYQWKAHNDAASGVGGSWPAGTYRWSHYNPHREMGASPGCRILSYGCRGIHVFHVLGREGMGVHAGRTASDGSGLLGGSTLGCVRVTEEAMVMINRMHNTDPIEAIVIE